MAVLVVRNQDRAVLAYLGSTDYYGSAGMVDMVRARRSPGSTLKPFIYGFAFDDTLITPDSLIEDQPLRLGDYAPRNFDGEFHGTVSAREALQQSYNLPAIELLDAIGPARFAALLNGAGVPLTMPRGVASLPIALGGVGTTMEDLATLYVGLASGGKVGRLRLLDSDPLSPETAILTEAAAWQVGDILRGSPMPSDIARARARPISYKTGTSYGYRDAWAIGYSPRYTVAVWVGRIEGTPRPGAFGRESAAPVLFRLFDLLPPEEATPRPKPASLAEAGFTRLAPDLKHFGFGGTASAHEMTGPQIIFPPADAVLEVGAESLPSNPISLEASGGRPPYRWAVNGMPLPVTPAGLNASWTPDGPGFVRISVTDGMQRTAHETIRLQ
jgi:penicillin-binding protein 1C